MNTLLHLLPPGDLQQNGSEPARLLVLVAAHAASHTMLAFAAHLATRGPLRVLDGGNRFNAYIVARDLRGLNQGDLAQTLARIQVARAFTCYQVAALLEATPLQRVPTLVIDMLDTFYDESVPLAERRRLASQCSRHLRRLSQAAPVMVSLRPPPPPRADPTGLCQAIQSAADIVWLQEVLPPAPTPRLFE